MPLLEQLGAFLAAEGCGTVGVDLFLGRLPEKAGTVVGLLEYGGEPSVQTMMRPVVLTPRLQVCGRSDSYTTVRTRIGKIHALLDGYRGTAMPGVYWIEALSPPFRLGADENLRELVAFNVRAHCAHPAPVAVAGGGEVVGVGVNERSGVV